jgi:hypothetical protein
MQTFLPYADFAASAQTLDRQRLGKQRVECLQIAKTLHIGGGWANHPAVKMWRGHINALVRYGIVVCDEWTSRGYKDTCRDKLLVFASPFGDDPMWLGDPELHRSHRSNLIRKLPEHYAPQFESGLPADLEYVWPV